HDLPFVTGDRVQLQQVVFNLIGNAADAMKHVEDRPRLLAVTTWRNQNDWVDVAVRDSGIGFDADVAGKLFDAFYTTKDEGMGIGLSVCRTIVEGHGGQLRAAANDDHGATFSFSIPSVPNPP